jgi:sortase A
MQVGVYKSKENPQLRRGILTFILSALLVLGMCLLLYPSFSNWYNEDKQTTVIEDYSEQVAHLSQEDYDKYLNEAREYNSELANKGYSTFTLSEEEEARYESLLNLDSVMGYIEIPSIRVKLPIYHGTSDEILQIGVGHIAGTSLPVGGESTHCVLSGHRGLPSSKLFTDLDMLTTGDVFVITVLNETLTYEVDQVLIVDPDDTSALGIVEGEDLCTLVTCTPYGINTHRLLVRGHRIANLADYSNLTGDASQIEPILVAPFAGIPVLTLLLYMVLRKPKAEAAAEDAAADSAEKTGMAGRARKHHGPARLLDLLRHLFDRGGPGPDDPSPGGGGGAAPPSPPSSVDVRGRASQAGTIFDGDTAGAAGLTGTTNGRAGARTPRKDA